MYTFKWFTFLSCIFYLTAEISKMYSFSVEDILRHSTSTSSPLPSQYVTSLPFVLEGQKSTTLPENRQEDIQREHVRVFSFVKIQPQTPIFLLSLLEGKNYPYL